VRRAVTGSLDRAARARLSDSDAYTAAGENEAEKHGDSRRETAAAAATDRAEAGTAHAHWRTGECALACVT